MTASRYLIWYGRDEPPVARREVRAGALVALLEGPDLRYVKVGGVELLRRLYMAVRDHNWDTIPGEISGLEVAAGTHSFDVRFESHHRSGDVDFRWRGRITGSTDGTIAYEMDGVAGAEFRYNRIGLCLLHPPGAAGRRYLGRTPDGPIGAQLPLEIGPQKIAEGKIHALFPAFDALSIGMADGLWADFQLEGDLFEMEDQRNWTDGSFKTYSTPLLLGFPHQASAGETIRQRAVISVTGSAPETAGDGRLRVTLGGPTGRTLPPIGLGTASHGHLLSPRELELLRALRPDHLRVDLQPVGSGFRAELERATAHAAALEVALEVALFLGEDPERELGEVSAVLPGRVARVLVFKAGEPVTASRWVRLARERLETAAPGAAFVGGTNVYFTDLNRNRPKLDGLDGVAWSVNPQVHAFDESSLVENVEAQADTVRSARAFCGDLELVVSPVTLRPRFNPNATGPEPQPAPGELPNQVDPRQASLFGAVWTAGSAKYLAESGAASITFYETSGWRGVVETEAGSPAPFPSRPGTAFPLYHVLADLGEWKGGELVEARSSDPLRVEALAIRTGSGLHVLLANMTPEPQRVALDAAVKGIRRLDEETFAGASAEPGAFRASFEPARELELAPYALWRLEL